MAVNVSLRFIAYLALLSAALSPAAAAGPWRHVVIDGAGPADMHTKAAGDLNGDGFIDLIVAGTGGELVWYQWPHWTRRVISTEGRWSTDAETADLDGDGDLDVVASDWYGDNRLVWFENFAGSGLHWRRHDLGSPRAHDIELADLDGDGDLDIVTRQQGGAGNVILVRLQKTLWEFVPREIRCPAGEGFDLADVDRDGDVDVILAGRWYATPDEPMSDAWVEHVYTAAWTHPDCTVRAADVNGDGRADVVLAPAEKAGGTYRLAWYEAPADATAGEWVEHVIDAGVETVLHSLAAADADGDGRLDVVTAEMHQSADPDEVGVYLNRGGGLAWERQVLATGGSHSLRVIDVGSDGDMDLFGANWSRSTQVDLWENRAAPQTGRTGVHALDKWTRIHADAARDGRAFGLAMGDFTGDGFADVVSGRWFYRNPGGAMTDPWERSALPGEVDALLVFDADLDNTPDVIAMNPAGEVLWIEPADNRIAAWRCQVIGRAGAADHGLSSQGALTAQLSPGGRPEVVINAGGLYYFAVPDLPAAGPWPRVRIAEQAYPEGVAAADVDGDGDVDLCGTSDGQTVVWWANPGDGSADWPAHAVGAMPSRYADRFGAADVNGDGRTDIVVSAANGAADGVYWWEQAPDGWTLHTVVRQGSTNSMAVADLDNDGDPDIVAGEHRGGRRTAVWENDGTGRFIEHVVATGIESHLGTRLADLDGDGDLDIVSIAWDRPADLHIWRNDARTWDGPRPAFVLFDGIVSHPGNRRLYDDWDFTLGMDFEPDVPRNWLEPINYAAGTYDVRLEILEMTPVDKPVYFGFGWHNLPREDDPTVQHRANKPIDVTGPGVYRAAQPVAADWHGPGYDDPCMPWIWRRAYKDRSFYTFIRPNGQNPFPLTFRLTVIVNAAAPAAEGPENPDVEALLAHSRRRKAAAGGMGFAPGAILYEPPFAGSQARVSITNDSDETMHLVGRFAPPAFMEVEPASIGVTVGPRASQGVDVRIAPLGNLDRAVPYEVRLDWTGRFTRDGAEPMEIAGSHVLHLEPLNICPPPPTEVAIDGDLGEWPDLPHEAETVGREYASTWSGPADASLRFAVGRDEERLVLAIRVRDDELRVPPGARYWQADAVQVWLGSPGGDPRPATRLVIAIAADGSVGELPEGAAAAVAPTADGYAVEIALPAAMAAELAGGDGRRLRVNIAQYDLDADGSTQLWWRASWINPATSYGRSGTFEQRPAASP